MLTPKRTMVIACVVLGCHACVIAAFGTSKLGATLSDTAQAAMGLLVIWTASQASRRSDSLGRYFWRIVAFSFCIWMTAQAISICTDVAFYDGSPQLLEVAMKILFALWFVPLGVALFLNPDQDLKEFDGLLIIDSLQAVGLLLVSYLFFFYIPSLSDPGNKDLSDTVVDRYFLVHAILIGAFFLRYFYDRSPARTLFRNIGFFLLVSSFLDFVYYAGPAQTLRTGAWFDLFWSAVLFIPLATAIWWKEPPRPGLPAGRVQAPAMIVTQLFPLLYPLLILALSSRVAQKLIAPAALVVLLSYACSSLRMIVTHQRLLATQKELLHEATHDGLTGVLNRTAILDILERELLRAERTGASVGVMMVDADHFKSLNDRYGHATGDAVLRKLTATMMLSVRPYDYVGRVGGEEFLVVTPECTAVETRILAERIRKQVEECRMMAGELIIRLTVSMGITAGAIGCDVRSILAAADNALYRAKHNGRNRVECETTRSSLELSLDAPAS